MATKPKPVRRILADNVKRLMEAQGKPQSLLKRPSGSNATIGRVLNVTGPRGPTLAILDDIAARFGLEPWHLLVEGLDPANRPTLLNNSPAEQEFKRRVAELALELGIDRRKDH